MTDGRSIRAIAGIIFTGIGAIALPCAACAAQAQSARAPLRLPVDQLGPPFAHAAAPSGLGALPAVPGDNPMTAEKIALGRRLFFAPVLSRDQTVACATCHDPEHGFASPDPVAVGIGGAKGRRNAPSLINRAYDAHLFHDGRAGSLEQQVLGPLVSETELGGDIDGALTRLRADRDFLDLFAKAFPDDHDATDPEAVVSVRNIARAIAGFERTLLSGDSAVDRFRASKVAALGDAARTGMWVFESRGGCWRCHSGATFSDGKFHNTGVSHLAGGDDLGRESVTGQPADRHAFKTPGLRDVSRSAPYMHDGSLATLEDVVEFYNRGGPREAAGLDPLLKPLELTPREKAGLVEFLKALDGNPASDPRGNDP